MELTEVRTEHEARQHPTDDELWHETHELDLVSADGALGVHVRLDLFPLLGLTWYWTAVVRDGRPLVTVIEPEAPVPPPPALELRCTGLWSDLVVETPLEHVSLGVEAFAVALDDPGEALRGCRGDITPLGFDLEWETDAGAEPSVLGGYELVCRAHGEVLVADETIEVDGWGRRRHDWGADPWWRRGSCRASVRWADGSFTHAPLAAPAVGDATVSWELDDMAVHTEVLAWSPAPVGPSGEAPATVARALCRFRRKDRTAGTGWLVLVQPAATT